MEKINSCDSCPSVEECKIPGKISSFLRDSDPQLPLTELNDWLEFFLTREEIARISRCPISYNGKALF